MEGRGAARPPLDPFVVELLVPLVLLPLVLVALELVANWERKFLVKSAAFVAAPALSPASF